MVQVEVMTYARIVKLRECQSIVLLNWARTPTPSKTVPLMPASSSAIIAAAFFPITSAVEYVFAETLIKVTQADWKIVIE